MVAQTAQFLAAIAITLANLRATRTYSSPLLHEMSEAKPKLVQHAFVFEDSNHRKGNFIREKGLRFKGFKEKIPRWGLVVSAKNFSRISHSKKIKNVELKQLSVDQIEIIADAETLQSLFEEDCQRSPDPSKIEVLVYNDTFTQVIRKKADAKEEYILSKTFFQSHYR